MGWIPFPPGNRPGCLSVRTGACPDRFVDETVGAGRSGSLLFEGRRVDPMTSQGRDTKQGPPPMGPRDGKRLGHRVGPTLRHERPTDPTRGGQGMRSRMESVGSPIRCRFSECSEQVGNLGLGEGCKEGHAHSWPSGTRPSRTGESGAHQMIRNSQPAFDARANRKPHHATSDLRKARRRSCVHIRSRRTCAGQRSGIHTAHKTGRKPRNDTPVGVACA